MLFFVAKRFYVTIALDIYSFKML